jgi:hypothetical protein
MDILKPGDEVFIQLYRGHIRRAGQVERGPERHLIGRVGRIWAYAYLPGEKREWPHAGLRINKATRAVEDGRGTVWPSVAVFEEDRARSSVWEELKRRMREFPRIPKHLTAARLRELQDEMFPA